MMTLTKKTNYTKDVVNKKMTIEREFSAPLTRVWAAWTESELLDQWWAPKPWKAETKSMNFKEGGKWLYCMVGPDGSKQWCLLDYISINPMKTYTAEDAFCDENGKKSEEMPGMHWVNNFEPTANGTKVTINITFKSEDAMNKIIEMGFEEGFAMAHENLDELLAAQ